MIQPASGNWYRLRQERGEPNQPLLCKGVEHDMLSEKVVLHNPSIKGDWGNPITKVPLKKFQQEWEWAGGQSA